MANPLRGEFPVVLAGKKRKFRLGMSAICSLERARNMPFQKIMDLERLQFADLVDVLYYGLLADDPDLTLDDICAGIEEHEDPQALFSLIQKSMNESSPRIFKQEGGADPLKKKQAMT